VIHKAETQDSGLFCATAGGISLCRTLKPIFDYQLANDFRSFITNEKLAPTRRHYCRFAPSSIHDAEKLGQPELSSLCLPQAISQCDHSVADALPFARIEALRILKTDIGEKPASFANKLHV
jgi:hypothetical protein